MSPFGAMFIPPLRRTMGYLFHISLTKLNVFFVSTLDGARLRGFSARTGVLSEVNARSTARSSLTRLLKSEVRTF